MCGVCLQGLQLLQVLQPILLLYLFHPPPFPGILLFKAQTLAEVVLFLQISLSMFNSLPAAAGVIAGGSLVCQGENARVYSVPPIVGATQYNWTVPVGVTIVSGQGTNSITVNFSTTAMNGNIQVSGYNNCGDGIPSTLAFTVDPLPVGAGAITGLTPVCQGMSGSHLHCPSNNPMQLIISGLYRSGLSIASGANTPILLL